MIFYVWALFKRFLKKPFNEWTIQADNKFQYKEANIIAKFIFFGPLWNMNNTYSGLYRVQSLVIAA
jgi:hypothetical protein